MLQEPQWRVKSWHVPAVALDVGGTVRRVDPVREAEHILRGNQWRRGWWVAVVVLVGVAFVVVAQAAPGPARPMRSWTVAAELRSGDSSPWCAEGLTVVAGHAWTTIDGGVDHVRLPLRGRLRVVNAADAVFTAHRVRLELSPAMPCTPG